jgi:flavodoxin
MIVYASVGGTTRKVARRVADRLAGASLHEASCAAEVLWGQRPRYILLMCPTYGDSELEDSFENLLFSFDWSALRGTGFAFCEVGIYTGYEEFGHGLASQVVPLLKEAGLVQLAPSLSLDSVPVTDWSLVDDWANLIQASLEVPQ